MSEANKELVRRYYQVTSGDLAGKVPLRGIEDIVAADFVDHHFPPNLPPGPTGVCTFFNDVLGAFSEREIAIDELVAEGDRVVCKFALLANHTAEFAGIPATGRHISCAAYSTFRIADGKLAEAWELADLFGLFQQLQAQEPAVA
jgi:predicted ester cyclase